VYGTDGPGCTAQQVVSVISNTLPMLQVSPASTTVCAGSFLELVGSGAFSYTWMPVNLNAPNIVLFPQSSITYTLIGQGQNQCKNSIMVPVVVEPCLGMAENDSKVMNVSVYPNPSNGLFNIDFTSKLSKTIMLFTVDGKLLQKVSTNKEKFEIDISMEDKGFYILKVLLGNKEQNFKLLLQ